MKILILLMIVAFWLAGCAKPVPVPEKRLPMPPAAYLELPERLSEDERQLCVMAAAREQQGLLRAIPSLCRKVETNALGWQSMVDWVRRILFGVYNRDGDKLEPARRSGWFGV